MDIIETRILKLLSEKPMAFEDLLNATWGIYPIELSNYLERLSVIHKVKKDNKNLWYIPGAKYERQSITKIKNQDRKVEEKIKKFIAELPNPHPHDYDWRFHIIGLKNIFEHIKQYHKPEEPICILAAPTLYVYLHEYGYFTKLSLVERSKNTVEAIKKILGTTSGIQTHDIQRPWPQHLLGDFSCVVMDLPWYQDYYELFLSRAAKLTVMGGFIHAALFPLFTRKDAYRERASIFSFAKHIGLSLVDLSNGLIHYETPTFENISLDDREIHLPSNWRKGDMVTFYVGNRYDEMTTTSIDTGTWKEFITGKSKIKLRMSDIKRYEKPSVQNIEDGTPILSSVSRRYDKRDSVGLWTSHMQAFSIKGEHVVHILLENLVVGHDYEHAVKEVSKEFDIDLSMVTRQCKDCYQQLIEIIEREHEYAK